MMLFYNSKCFANFVYRNNVQIVYDYFTNNSLRVYSCAVARFVLLAAHSCVENRFLCDIHDCGIRNNHLCAVIQKIQENEGLTRL